MREDLAKKKKKKPDKERGDDFTIWLVMGLTGKDKGKALLITPRHQL